MPKPKITYEGQHFLLGQDGDHYAIWAKGRRLGDPVASFPAGEAGWAAAWAQFSAWEPNPTRAAAASTTRPRWLRNALIGAGTAVLAAGAAFGGINLSSGHPAGGGPSASQLQAGSTSPDQPGSVTPTTVANASPGYLYTDQSTAMFLEWARSGSQVDGSVTDAYIDPGNATAVKTDHAGFTGVVSGSDVTLTFAQILGFSESWSGTISGDSVTLNFTDSAGNLVQAVFHAADTNAYNRALAALQSAAGQARYAAQVAAEEQARQEALAKAQHRIASDISAVSSDIASLNQAAGQLPAALSDLPGQLDKARQDVAKAQIDDQTTHKDAQSGQGSGNVCADSSDVAADVSDVESDQSDVLSTQSDLRSAESSVSSAKSSLDTDFADLTQALAALADYRPSGIPTSGDVSGSEASAAKQTTAQEQAMNYGLNTVGQLLTQAKSYAADAQQVCSSAG